MKWILILLLTTPIALGKSTSIYPPVHGESEIDWRERLTIPHIFPGQTIVSNGGFLEDALRPESSTVRWTSKASYSINLDKIHLARKDYVLIIKSKKGPSIRMLPWETTKIYLEPNYYKIRYSKETQTVWLARYAD